jgi:hypothetical protein
MTGHYDLTISSSYANKKVADPGISVMLPDGNFIMPSDTASLLIPSLPATVCDAHLFPALASGSLISIGQLCDHDCTAVFTAETVTINCHGKTVLAGLQPPMTRLWSLDLSAMPTSSAAKAVVNSAQAVVDSSLCRYHAKG